MRIRELCFALAFAFGGSSAIANEFESELTSLAGGQLSEIIKSDLIVSAIKAQNVETAGYDQAKIDELDQTWRAEVESNDQPMIDRILDNELSGYLMDVQDNSDGLITEVFVMDAKGLNVGQSDVTSDFWQGDEAKWQDTFGKGPSAVLIGELEQDDSTQLLQSQVSLSIADPDTGEVIGAVTFGINVEKL